MRPALGSACVCNRGERRVRERAASCSARSLQRCPARSWCEPAQGRPAAVGMLPRTSWTRMPSTRATRGRFAALQGATTLATQFCVRPPVSPARATCTPAARGGIATKLNTRPNSPCRSRAPIQSECVLACALARADGRCSVCLRCCAEATQQGAVCSTPAGSTRCDRLRRGALVLRRGAARERERRTHPVQHTRTQVLCDAAKCAGKRSRGVVKRTRRQPNCTPNCSSTTAKAQRPAGAQPTRHRAFNTLRSRASPIPQRTLSNV